MILQIQHFFEIAWEVCNQVGGIYTVIRSKVPSVIEKWGQRQLFLIGPYFADQAAAHFDPATDFSTPIGKAVLKLQERGFDVHYGQWIVSGRPNVMLFNPYSVFDKLGEIKHFLWKDYHISIPGNDDLLDKVAAFGYQVKEFFNSFMFVMDFDRITLLPIFTSGWQDFQFRGFEKRIKY